mgnify:CR=1 FL=1
MHAQWRSLPLDDFVVGPDGTVAVGDSTVANAMLRRLREIDEDEERYVSSALKEIQRLQAGIETFREARQRERGFLVSALEAWSMPQLRGHRSRHIDLPYGRLQSRVQPSKLEIVDMAALTQWAANRPDLLKQPEPEVSKALLNEHFKRTGEIPPGTELLPEKETLTYSTV